MFVYIHYSAGHATTLPRQSEHAFRPRNCGLLHYVVIRRGHRGLKIVRIFSCLCCSNTVRCRVVSCCEAKKWLLSQL